MNTATVSLAVTPTVLSTLLSHYLNRKPLRQRPTAHLSYDEGLHLIRAFLAFASHHTVEELQAFTSQWVPHPQWVKVKEVEVPDSQLTHAAALLEAQLGPEGIRQVGGRRWWQWRKPRSALKAEWIEMRANYNERKRSGAACQRVMLYVHGGAYFFGSVDEHRYQLQRHARKLKGRVFAPRYRLAPQFPFPCGLQDCLAAYLYLITVQEPNTIVLAGDSAGGGMVVSLLVTLRDQGIPLPAGAVLISPWVDLTHSFPSVAGECPFDYIPQCGFHHKPSRSWPPPDEGEIEELKKLLAKPDERAGGAAKVDEVPNVSRLSVAIDGKQVEIKEQIQMYATNDMLSHPLVSPVLQPTLGGLPPLLIMVGGGEILRDEQIYMAHKCANPSKYLPAEAVMNERAMAQLEQFKPTDVYLQVWDDLCHVAPTLSFTRPAKYMFRSIAQFSAWALARAQKTGIDILDDDQISIISTSSDSETEDTNRAKEDSKKVHGQKPEASAKIGKAGDPLPTFRAHMIRQRVTRHGDVFDLAPATELAGCTVDRIDIGVVKVGPVRKWLETRRQWDTRYAGAKSRVRKKRLRDMAAGYESFGAGEFPPPSALAGRRKIGEDLAEKKKTRSMGLALWSLWGSKHDEVAVNLEQQADREPEVKAVTPSEGQGARPFTEIENQEATLRAIGSSSRSRSRRRIVQDDHQTEVAGETGIDENTPVANLLAGRQEKDAAARARSGNLLSPNFVPNTGVAGRRPTVEGVSMPFSLKKDAETASMVTLTSAVDPQKTSRIPSPEPTSSDIVQSADEEGAVATERDDKSEVQTNEMAPSEKGGMEVEEKMEEKGNGDNEEKEKERPGLDTFVTASSWLPKATGA